MTLKKKEPVAGEIVETENPAEEEKEYTVSLSLKNGIEIAKVVKTTNENLSKVVQNVSDAMNNPSIKGSITLGNTLVSLSEIVYITVEINKEQKE